MYSEIIGTSGVAACFVEGTRDSFHSASLQDGEPCPRSGEPAKRLGCDVDDEERSPGAQRAGRRHGFGEFPFRRRQPFLLAPVNSIEEDIACRGVAIQCPGPTPACRATWVQAAESDGESADELQAPPSGRTSPLPVRIRLARSRASLRDQSIAASTSAQNFAIRKVLPPSKPRRTITVLCDGTIIAYWPCPPFGE